MAYGHDCEVFAEMTCETE